MEAERLPAMCGRLTLTTVVSSTYMNVPNMTAIATIHGLMCGRSAVATGLFLPLGELHRSEHGGDNGVVTETGRW